MKKHTLAKFSVSAIIDRIGAVGLESARLALAFAVGSMVEASGKVQKVVKRDGQAKLVIESGDVPGVLIFAHWTESEMLRNAKVRKGSAVVVKGSLMAFGASAVNLSACRLMGNNKKEIRKNLVKPSKS